MTTATVAPVLQRRHDGDNCHFRMPTKPGLIDKLTIPSLGYEVNTSHNWGSNREIRTGYIAVRKRPGDPWVVEAAEISADRHGDININCREQENYPDVPEHMAYPIDPLMERSDIEGATIIEPNAAGTAWEFFHATAKDHHDRELAIQGAIVGASQRSLDDADLDVIRHRKNPAVQNAKILAYGRLVEFRNDWVGYALVAEQRQYIGHHIREGTHIHECVIDSLNEAIAEWKKNKADAWTPIQYAVENVLKPRVTNLHAYPDPWNHSARVVIRNLKKAKAEAEAAEESEGGE